MPAPKGKKLPPVVKLTPPIRKGVRREELTPSEIAVLTPLKGGLRTSHGEELAGYFGIRR